MNYFHIDIALRNIPVRILVADTVPVIPGQSKKICFQVCYSLPGGDRELLLVLGEAGWTNESAFADQGYHALVRQRFPELSESYLTPDEKLSEVSTEEIGFIGARISEYMVSTLREELGMYNRNLANSFYE